jgi:hypothetical protein
VVEERSAEIADISFLAIAEPVEDGWRVMQRLDQPNLRNGKLGTGLKKDIPGDALITKPCCQGLGYFLAPTERSS